MIHADAKICDQPNIVGKGCDQRGINCIGYRRHEHVRPIAFGDHFGSTVRLIVLVQPRFEKFHHPGFDRRW